MIQNTLIFKTGIYTLALLLTVTSCKVADLRTDRIKNATPSSIDSLRTEGIKILNSAYEKQGLEHFVQHKNYQFTAHEMWYGFLGKVANSWPVNDVQLQFSYRINSFDGRMEILEGEKKGAFFGLQSWEYYEGNANKKADFEVKRNEKIVFTIPAYHYFMELLIRLKNVPVIEYAGNAKVDGIAYQMVLATWGNNSKPTTEYDQYLVYINTQTGLMDYCTYTAHGSQLMGSKSATATIHYSNYKTINGALIPMQQKVILSKPSNSAQPIHQMTISAFEFDVVSDGILFPNKNLKPVGDEKPTTTP